MIPTDPPDQLTLFTRGEVEGVWTVEPWVSRLESEAAGKIYFEESVLWPETGGKYVTTHVVSSTEFMKKHPHLVTKWIKAQEALTDWINKNQEQAKELVLLELKQETRIEMKKELLDQAWKRILFTTDPIKVSLIRDAEQAYKIGFLKKMPDLTDIYDLKLLQTGTE